MAGNDTYHRDASEYDEASYEPQVTASDKPDEIIRDAIESVWTGKLPATKNEFFAQCKAAAVAILRELHMAGNIESVKPQGAPAGNGSLLLAGILGEIIASNEPGLTAHCAAFAFDLGIISESQTKIAKQFRVTKGTVSHICRNLVETYRDGKPSPAMKSPDAVRKYSGLRKGKCAKQPHSPWEFANKFSEAFTNARETEKILSRSKPKTKHTK